MALQNDSLILKILNKHKKFLDQNIKKYLKKLAAPQEIIDIMSYAVLGGGKRIRPFLLAEFAKLYGVKANIYKYPCYCC